MTDRAEIEKLKKTIDEQKKEIFQLKNIIWNLPGEIYWKNRDGVYLGHNSTIAARNGDIVGKTDYEIFEKNIADEFRKNDCQAMDTASTVIVEEILRENDVDVIQVAIKKPLLDENNKIIGVMGNNIDITTQKKIDALKKENEITRKIAETMQILAGSIAHELRTPLASINIYLDLLTRDCQALKLVCQSDKAEKAIGLFMAKIDTVRGIVKTCAQMTTDILVRLRSCAGNKIDAGSMKFCSIVSSIKETLAAYPFVADEKQLVTCNLDKDFIYHGDLLLTKHLLINLIKNSLHAIKESGKGAITIETKIESDVNRLIVTDTALGISSNFLPKIFNQFETRTSSGDGAGLGLAFCKLVMQSFGGDITCESEQGENAYTKFILSFPKVINKNQIG